MIGHGTRRETFRKSRATQHFYEASFGWIESHKIQALVFHMILIHQDHGRLWAWVDDAFHQSKFIGELGDISYDAKGILQVIEKTKTKDQVEFTEVDEC